jgi:hypothetical protein
MKQKDGEEINAFAEQRVIANSIYDLRFLRQLNVKYS